jgi:hypothetical protein
MRARMVTLLFSSVFQGLARLHCQLILIVLSSVTMSTAGVIVVSSILRAEYVYYLLPDGKY